MGKKTIAVLIALLAASLVACAAPAAAPTATPGPAPKPAATSTPTAAPAVTPSPTALPKAAPTLTATPTPAAKASPAVSKPEGTLRIGVDSLGTERFLPNQAGSTFISLLGASYEYLIGRKIPTGELVPQLAEKWEVSPSGLDWTFWLRKGTQFHDNWGELTADDVKFTIELAGKEASINTQANTFRKWTAEVVNPYQLVIHTKQMDVSLPYQTASYLPVLPIVSKKYVEKVGEAAAGARPVGTGPYKFVEQKTGAYLKLEALDSHWRKTGEFKTIMEVVVPEQSTRLAMLKTGELDVAPLSLAYKKEAQAMGIKLISQPKIQDYWVVLDGQYLPERPTFDKNVPWAGPTPERALKVRQALNLAVNKQEIIDAIFQGEGEQLSVPRGWAGFPWDDPSLKPYPYDPAKSKQLLTEAGYPNGFEITMQLVTHTSYPEGPTIGQAVAMYWEKIGVKAKMVPNSYEISQKELEGRKTAGVAHVRAQTLKDEPTLQVGMRSDALFTYIVESKYVDGLLTKAVAERDFNKRVAIYRELGKFYYDGYYCIPIALRNGLVGVSGQVGQLANLKGVLLVVNLEYITRR